MSAPSLHIDLPDPEGPSVWPWLIALIAGASMLAFAALSLDSIPASLQHNAQEAIDQANFNSLTAVADGRDITISGTVLKQQSVTELMDSIHDIQGVRLVRDELTITDPEAEHIQNTKHFLNALSQINLSSVGFQPGSSSFTSDSRRALEQLAHLMNSDDRIRIRIEGHTDNTGPESVNMRLSRERAHAVVNFIVNNGVAADRLIAQGYGSTQPIDENLTEAGRSKNRRIEVSYVN